MLFRSALFLSGLLGVAFGVLLGRHLPAGVFRAASAVIFAACGVVRLFGGMERLLPRGWAIAATVTGTMIFLWLCVHRLQRKGGRHDTAGDQSLSLQ